MAHGQLCECPGRFESFEEFDVAEAKRRSHMVAIAVDMPNAVFGGAVADFALVAERLEEALVRRLARLRQLTSEISRVQGSSGP